MAYFAQAGQGRAYAQGSGHEQDTAPESTYTQQYSGQQYAGQNSGGQNSGGQHYSGPGAEPNYGYEDPAYGYQPEGQGHGPQDYAVFAAPAGLRARFSKSLSILGAVASIALVAGVGFWGYKLVMRDVSGVPVVRAAEGPMREQPVLPGGSQADHQGLAVNAVAASGSAEAPADRLTLAPAAIELTEDDKPLPELAAEAAPAAAVPAAPVEPGVPAAPGVSEEAVASFQNGDIDALVAELAREAEPLSAAVPASAQAPAIVQPEPLQPALAAAVPSPAILNAPGVKVSLRPSARPTRFSPAPAAAAPAARAGTVDVDPATLAAGTRLAQLGAYESPEVARAEWDRIHARFADYLEGKQRVIQRAESGGRTFYRLRAMGFAGLSDARRFCSALVAGNADCIPVTTR
ncbi:SPOR domain-containing protein [Leisingera sp. M527]|uniref:SPOR domain-containing protein n=1 Tax=Leisingera sp. M527 TaxID=2867014 RepID=UPI0021A51F64|nr:SPOR domain-containing protein [Leisingera sp. M527]UWQ34301.1 SPOR domain-containing protein [Leisingera sp. M527]